MLISGKRERNSQSRAFVSQYSQKIFPPHSLWRIVFNWLSWSDFFKYNYPAIPVKNHHVRLTQRNLLNVERRFWSNKHRPQSDNVGFNDIWPRVFGWLGQRLFTQRPKYLCPDQNGDFAIKSLLNVIIVWRNTPHDMLCYSFRVAVGNDTIVS